MAALSLYVILFPSSLSVLHARFVSSSSSFGLRVASRRSLPLLCVPSPPFVHHPAPLPPSLTVRSHVSAPFRSLCGGEWWCASEEEEFLYNVDDDDESKAVSGSAGGGGFGVRRSLFIHNVFTNGLKSEALRLRVYVVVVAAAFYFAWTLVCMCAFEEYVVSVRCVCVLCGLHSVALIR